MFKEFRNFIARGNVVDLAVALVMGSAFTAVVNSLVNDIIMPLVGILLGGIDFASLSVQVGEAQVMYGNFIQAIINFLIIAWVIFLLIKAINRFHEKQEAVPAGPTNEEKLLTEIRDLLRRQGR